MDGSQAEEIRWVSPIGASSICQCIVFGPLNPAKTEDNCLYMTYG